MPEQSPCSVKLIKSETKTKIKTIMMHPDSQLEKAFELIKEIAKRLGKQKMSQK